MSIASRLVLVLLGLFCVTVALGGTTWVFTRGQEADGLVINLAGRQRMLSQKAAKEALSLGQGTGAQDRAGLDATVAVFEKTLSALRSGGAAPLTLDPGGAMAVLPPSSEAVGAQLDEVRRHWTAFRSLLDDPGDPALRARIAGDSVAVLGAMNKAVGMLQHESEAGVARLLRIQAGAIALALVVLGVSVYFVRRRIAVPLKHLTDFTACVGTGDDVTGCAQGHFTAELLVLREALTDMVGSLSGTMDELREKEQVAASSLAEAEAASERANEALHQAEVAKSQGMYDAALAIKELTERIGVATHRLNDKIDEVSKGAALQRELNAEAASSLQRMAEAGQEIADSSTQAADDADRAKDTAERGAASVEEVVSAIGAVEQSTDRMKRSIDELNTRADGIAQILTLITDIADQTNLLALNAAIEAARAGDAGRGFAVVADEVRKLAEKTMHATTDVGEAVRAIQEGTRQTLDDMDQALAAVERSTELAGGAGTSLKEIVEMVAQTSARVRPFVTLAGEQAEAGDRVNLTMERITEIADSSVAGATDGMGMLGALLSATAELEDMVAKLSDNKLAVVYEQEQMPSATAPQQFLTWTPALAVGVEKIDEQHKHLVQMVNRLYAAVRDGSGQAVISDLFDGLKKYVTLHFTTEERLMKGIGYAELDAHMAQHQALEKKALDLEEQWNAGGRGIEVETLSFLKDWLVNHIQKIDKRYSDSFARAGIQ